MLRGFSRALTATAAIWIAAARDDAAILAGVYAAAERLRENIKAQNWLGVADYSPNDRVEVGVKADGSAMGGFKGGATEAAVFANLLGATIPRVPPGSYVWEDDTFVTFVESERVVHVVGYGHAAGYFAPYIACGLFNLPDHRGFSTYSRYRLDLDGRWRIQVTLFPVGNASAQFRLSGGRPPTSPCPSSPRSPLLGNAPMFPGTENLVSAVHPTSDEQAGFAQTTGFGIGTAEQSEQAKRAAADRSAALSLALRNRSSPDAARRFFSPTAAVVPEGADRFIGVDRLLARAQEAPPEPMRTTWAFDEQDGVVHEVGLGGYAERYYSRWELQGGEWKVTVHVFPVGPPDAVASAAGLPAREATRAESGPGAAAEFASVGFGACVLAGVLAGVGAARLVLARRGAAAGSDFARLDA